ncbi:MAG: DUF1674 domain-containing protein [Gammaproteobacteria bacterium]|nr:DUF1674 domain-containing protein [Gammaproteobacteria bacterium]
MQNVPTTPPARTEADASPPLAPEKPGAPEPREPRPAEIGGPQGPEPTRYGDWERRGRCIDF